MSNKDKLIEYIYNNIDLLRNRDFLIEIMTATERVNPVGTNDSPFDPGNVSLVLPEPYPGKLIAHNGEFFRLVEYRAQDTVGGDNHFYHCVIEATGISVPGDADALISPQDKITLPPGVVANYTGTDPLETTFGRLLANYVFLANPFGSTIPYINSRWSPEAIEARITDLIIRGAVTAAQMDHFARNLFHLGHTTELCVPAVSRKALTVNPEIIKRKQELIAQYKDRLEQNDPVAMALIEAELIAMDKKDLEGDISMGFLISGKNFAVHRKAMFLTKGMMETFGDSGNFGFMENSLSEGWTVDDFPKIANEIRSSSYSRAKETALGGEEAKFLMRVAQNIRITEQNCGSTTGLPYKLDKMVLNEFSYRYVIEGDDIVLLVPEILSQYLGKDVLLRSPTYCRTRDGFCYVCCGKLYETINQESLVMASVSLGSTFTTASLKKSHGKSVEVLDIKGFSDFVF